MKPIMTVEFLARSGEQLVDEESVVLHSPEEFLRFVEPGGGCEAIPDRVAEIHFNFVSGDDPAEPDPLTRRPATLQVGMVVVSGPLAKITEALDRLREHAAAGRLSGAFLDAIGAAG